MSNPYTSAMPSLFLIILLLAACASDDPPTGPDPADDDLSVTVHWNDTRQTLHGFGASDAWSIQHVGTWPDAKREAIADLLFSTEADESGRPLGVGLSVWRFNIGGGSVEQGEASGIGDPWRRAEGFLQDDLSYDWSRQAGQQWFMRAARERGVETVIGFVNSPPVELTRTGNAYGGGGTSGNLAPEQYDAFAEFLTTVAGHFADEGLPFDYLSPVNEPQWDWARGNNQEGSPYHNDEIAALTRSLDEHLAEAGLDTQIEIPEAAKIDYLYSDDTDRPQRDDQLAVFFGEERLQELPHVAAKAAAHSYFTTWPVDAMIEQRKRLRAAVEAVDPDLEYWMSEYCILADNEQIQGNGRDLGMDPALYVARLIHYDLTLTDAASWQWWLAVSPYDYKDGLVYVDKNEDDGRYYDSKLLWALGNYSRFLQPGAIRVGTSRSDDASDLRQAHGLMVSAYRSADGTQPVVVAVNYGRDEQAVAVDVEGHDVQSWQPYVTSDTSDLEPGATLGAGESLAVPGRSVVTLVGRTD